MISIGEDSIVNAAFIVISKNDAFLMVAGEKLGTESGKWSYETNFGSSKDDPDDSLHVWNIGSYIIAIAYSNDYYRTLVADKDKYVLTFRRKVSY